jgi:hypothetical protein
VEFDVLEALGACALSPSKIRGRVRGYITAFKIPLSEKRIPKMNVTTGGI